MMDKAVSPPCLPFDLFRTLPLLDWANVRSGLYVIPGSPVKAPECEIPVEEATALIPSALVSSSGAEAKVFVKPADPVRRAFAREKVIRRRIGPLTCGDAHGARKPSTIR